MKRNATALWTGTGKEGTGSLTTQSNLVKNLPYTWATRFENAAGSNPEELIAAAHAGCYSIKLSFLTEKAGLKSDSLETTCTVDLENGAIINSHLVVKAKIVGCTSDQFAAIAEEARATCPISKSLSCTVTLEASLV
ncbi:peroxiredoxin [Bacteroidota bacterium]|nr:peroxiredoxin [Bacteroidota bacterium]